MFAGSHVSPHWSAMGDSVEIPGEQCFGLARWVERLAFDKTLSRGDDHLCIIGIGARLKRVTRVPGMGLLKICDWLAVVAADLTWSEEFGGHAQRIPYGKSYNGSDEATA